MSRPPHRICCDCKNSRPYWLFSFRHKRCDDCQRVIFRRYKRTHYWRRKGALPPSNTPLWTAEEHARLHYAVHNGFTIEQAAAHVGGRRSGEACRRRVLEYHWPRLARKTTTRAKPKPKWSEKQITRIRRVWERHGQREAARLLDLSPGTVSGIVHRYFRHSRGP